MNIHEHQAKQLLREYKVPVLNGFIAFNKMLGIKLVTNQTGPDGKVVKRVYIEDGCNIDKEFY